MEIPSKNFSFLEKEIQKEKINSCLIHHKGETIFQYYKNRKMENKLHKVNSVTKSFVSILVGIAIDEGLIKSVQTPIFPYFPDLEDDIKKQITIEHLLTMTPGFKWEEFGDWGGRPFPMINSNNWVQFVLEKELVTAPGEIMSYNSGCSHLLSAIIQKASNMTLEKYAFEKLFKPLEITDYRLHQDSKGIGIGGFGLSLISKDLLKTGILMLQNGVWKNKQIVSKDWIEASTSKKYEGYDWIGSYAYHWWVLEDARLSSSIYFAMGYGGNFIIINPAFEFVIVFTSELFNHTFLPMDLFKKFFFE
ncbi:serine hydrolase domain-containing protein [Lederbergia panacisoli]|uniref:serine hydrolase domain-containing protein n=1 Tax=Lederbergia panacisoli TaxID=1255251 RepID=UPI00214AB53E|nr:serine hydrolase [Lederbergia panacisoli]MCR2821818.1 beta-lactamase family protein [Lederbergia panacisoli]